MTEIRGMVLIASADKNERSGLHKRLAEGGYLCMEAGSLDEAAVIVDNGYVQLILLDIDICDRATPQLLPEFVGRWHDVVVLVTASTKELSLADTCVQQGAYDYITKPFDYNQVIRSVGKAMEKRRLELQLRDYQRQLARIDEDGKEVVLIERFMEALVALITAFEANNKYFEGHSRRVNEISMAIGEELALGEDELKYLYWGSLLHDIGRIAVDQTIQDKPERLTQAEYEHIMTHCAVGARIAGSVLVSRRIVDVLEYHHARYDGQLPHQAIKYEDIPLLARVVAVADAFDAMNSPRAYRDRLSKEKALSEIRREEGTQYDPVVTQALLKISSERLSEKQKILIVDDEESIRLLVKSVLGSNYTILEARNGQEAIEVAESQQPALILMDMMMPKIDGLQACYILKNNLAVKNIPVIMLTGAIFDFNRALSADMGADGYLTKPFSPQGLIEMVDKYITRQAEIAAV